MTSLPATLPDPCLAHLKTARQIATAARREPRRGAIATTSAALGRLLPGGLERGSLSELVGRASSGRFSQVLEILAAATSSGESAALIDLGDSLDPRAAASAGIDLRRLLWVRPQHVKAALASAEAVLESGLPLLVLDLGLPPLRGGRGAEAAWLRIARAARARGVAVLVSSPYRVSGTAATTVLRASRGRPRWSGAAVRLLDGLGGRLEHLKGRGVRPGEHAFFQLRVDDVPTPAAEMPQPAAPRTNETPRRQTTATPVVPLSPQLPAARRANSPAAAAQDIAARQRRAIA